MKALLLAAGLGTRLRPFTNNIPKCLIPIGGRPLLDYWIYSMVEIGITTIIINTHYHAKSVHTFIKKHQHKDKIKILYEPELLGTGGTVRAAVDVINGDNVMIVHADNFCLAPMPEFVKSFVDRPNGTEITMMTFRTDNPKSCGIVELDENGVVQKFHEKVSNPPSNLASGAVFIATNNIIRFIEMYNKRKFDFSNDIIPKYLGKINTWENKKYHCDIGSPKNYQRCLQDWERLQNEGI